MEWISVKDRLPKETGVYWIVNKYYHPTSPLVVSFENGKFSTYIQGANHSYSVQLVATHWLPIPKYPEYQLPSYVE